MYIYLLIALRDTLASIILFTQMQRRRIKRKKTQHVRGKFKYNLNILIRNERANVVDKFGYGSSFNSYS